MDKVNSNVLPMNAKLRRLYFRTIVVDSITVYNDFCSSAVSSQVPRKHQCAREKKPHKNTVKKQIALISDCVNESIRELMDGGGE